MTTQPYKGKSKFAEFLAKSFNGELPLTTFDQTNLAFSLI
jgi:hypothetical protein